MKQKDIVIDIKNVTKRYSVRHERPTLSEKIVKHNTETYIALKNISLKIGRGEKIGLIGPNGAGKTTLLKIISGITTPTSGSIKTRGKIVSLINLEAGFHPDLTGEQNIYLNGMLLGMSKKDIENKIKDIIKLADIGDFIDVPLFTYSEGMKLKLGFSIAVNIDPDILILDEGIWAGDLKFQQLSLAKLNEFFQMKKTIIVVSHWLEYIKKNCNRIIIIKKGRVTRDGKVGIIRSYANSQV